MASKKIISVANWLLLILFSGLILAACGDSPTNTPAATTASSSTAASTATTAASGATTAASSATTTSNTTVASTAANGAATAASTATTAANGATTAASGAGASGPNPAAGLADPCIDPQAAAQAAPTVQPTPVSTVAATLPTLTYTGAREVKLADNDYKQVLGNINGRPEDPIVGKFKADALTFSLTSDAYDKVDAFYKNLFQTSGWQNLRTETDGQNKQAFSVYQKDGSKVVIQVDTPQDLSSYPQEFKNLYKQGDSIVLVVTGLAVSAFQPTPFAIPGSPTSEVKTGQKKFATIEMEKGGKITIQLCPNLAPKTVENFEKLATKGFYNGLTFHRVEKNPQPFVVQGGDPQGNGQGGPGYQIPDEFTTQKKHIRGTVAMAHSSQPNSAGSQFYITLAPTPHLDGGYAIFGQVIDGMDVVDNIAAGDKMKSVTITVK